jgi:hypothetical protein
MCGVVGQLYECVLTPISHIALASSVVFGNNMVKVNGML